MAIEIRELIVRIRVEDIAPTNQNLANTAKLKEDILKECKREIKRELNKKNER